MYAVTSGARIPHPGSNPPPVCPLSPGPFMVKDEWIGPAQNIQTYTHDVNNVGASNWITTLGTILTNGAGQLVVPSGQSTSHISLSFTFNFKFGFIISSLSTAIGLDRNISFIFGSNGVINIRDDIIIIQSLSEGQRGIVFDWTAALDKEVIIELIYGANGVVKVYLCGALVGTSGGEILWDDIPMLSFVLTRVNNDPYTTNGTVLLEELWISTA